MGIVGILLRWRYKKVCQAQLQSVLEYWLTVNIQINKVELCAPPIQKEKRFLVLQSYSVNTNT